jgi:hypothetical protein
MNRLFYRQNGMLFWSVSMTDKQGTGRPRGRNRTSAQQKEWWAEYQAEQKAISTWEAEYRKAMLERMANSPKRKKLTMRKAVRPASA